MDTVCGAYILCATLRLWRVFDSLHCLRLTMVSLPREVEHLPFNCFQFYPSRMSSKDMSTVGWSLVKLDSALLHLFHANRWKLLWYMLCWFQEEYLCLFIPRVMCCLHLCDVPYPSLALRRCCPVLSDQMPFYYVVRRQRFYLHNLVTQDPVVSHLDMYCTNGLMYRTMVLLARPTKVRC